MIGTAAALIGSAAISAGTSIFGGLSAKKSAEKAANIQAAAADSAGKHVEQTIADANPQITNAAANAGADVTAAAGRAGAGVTSSADRANALLNPYADTGATATGELNDGLVAGGQFNKTPTMEDITIDPGFAYRMKNAAEQLSRSQASRGGALGGGAARDLTTLSQDMASQEYSNAFNRYRTTREDNFNNLMRASDSGQAAAGKEGDNLQGAARYVGDTDIDSHKFEGGLQYDAARATTGNTIRGAEVAGEYKTGGANAKAAGEVGGSNALNAGLAGASSGISNALLLGTLLKNPTTPNFVPYASARPYHPPAAGAGTLPDLSGVPGTGGPGPDLNALLYPPTN